MCKYDNDEGEREVRFDGEQLFSKFSAKRLHQPRIVCFIYHTLPTTLSLSFSDFSILSKASLGLLFTTASKKYVQSH